MKTSKEMRLSLILQESESDKRILNFHRRWLLLILQKSDCDKPTQWISKPDLCEVTKYFKKIVGKVQINY